jgi:mannose-6-phosphate isomerase-like protein (cupin superfamily)
MAADALEHIVHELEPIALIIRSDYNEPGVHFFTPPNFSQQVAFIRHQEGKRIAPHLHNLIHRQVLYTQEVLFIRQGRVKVNLYSTNCDYICSRVLSTGDIILLCGGGHSFEMLEDTSMIEVKQGPYAQDKDKKHFEEDPAACQ